MIKRTYVLALLFVSWLAACSGMEHPEKVRARAPKATAIATDTIAIDTLKYNLQHSLNSSYAVLRNECNTQKNALRQQFQAATTDSVKKRILAKAGKLLEQTLVNGIFHHWYGTPWSFEGYTSTPRKGNIACGYFVSTTLQHAGLNINRYTLAQQNPANETKTLSCGDSVLRFTQTGYDSLLNYFTHHLPEGLYFAGLNFHVGYLLFRNNELFFIHSNYINAQGVLIEKAGFSVAFSSSDTYCITSISQNPALIKNWLLNTPVKTITSRMP